MEHVLRLYCASPVVQESSIEFGRHQMHEMEKLSGLPIDGNQK
jgi:hypothetical protein